MVSTENGTLWLWNDETGKLLASKKKLGTMVLSLAFNHDCTRIVSGDNAGALQLWNETLDRIGEPVKGHWVPEVSGYGEVSSVAFNHDSTRIVSGGTDGAVRLWNATTLLRIGDPMRGLTESEWVRSTGRSYGNVNGVAFNYDGSLIVSTEGVSGLVDN